jgi:beta-lactamase class A
MHNFNLPRRQLIQAATAVAMGGMAPTLWAQSPASASRFQQAVQQIETTSGGRLGVAVLDTRTGAAYAYRGAERFALCSTFKFLAAALVLARVDQGQEQLTRQITVQAADIVPYAPVTQPRVGGPPLTVAELCEAAITVSDNPAANLLLHSFGGPQALTAYARSLGDTATRLDRTEPHLNQATPGDPRDTTTPAAMLRTLQQVVLGDALSPASRAQLTRWLLDCKTGDRKLRALLPAGWRVADKTGSGGHGSSNDIAVLWPPGRSPVLVTSYLTETTAAQEVRDQALAEVGQLVAALVLAGPG